MSMHKRVRTWLGVGAIALWVIGMLFVCAIMLARHLVTLPSYTKNDVALQKALAAQRPAHASLMWMSIHVLYGECGCSRRVAKYLLNSPRPKDTIELIVLVGDDPKLRREAIARGFVVDVVTRKELEPKYTLQSVPVLALLDPLDRLRYVGGYTTRKQGPKIQDISILNHLKQDRSMASLPLFGCAVSRELQKQIDPTGLF